MAFITIAQYFNKLYSVLFALLLAPLLAFIILGLVLRLQTSSTPIGYVMVILMSALLTWSAAWSIFNKKIKSVRNEQGLGSKLNKYFHVTIVRYSLLSSGSLMLAGGLYLSGNDLFTAMYLASLVLAGIQWPTGRRVCRDLQLKGDEREMVSYAPGRKLKI